MKTKVTTKRNANKASGPNERFANLMSELGMTGAELARRIDVHEATVSHWKTGTHDVPGAVMAYLDLYAKMRSVLQ